MKPTFQTSQSIRREDSQRPAGLSHGKSSVIDWNFQSSAPDLRGSNAFNAPVAPGFRVLTQGLFEAERRNYRLEGGAFVAIIALAIWPMIAAAQAAFTLIK